MRKQHEPALRKYLRNKRRDAVWRISPAINIPSQEFLSNGSYLLIQFFDTLHSFSFLFQLLFPSCISRLQMVPGTPFITFHRDVLVHFSLNHESDDFPSNNPIDRGICMYLRNHPDITDLSIFFSHCIRIGGSTSASPAIFPNSASFSS